MVTRGDHGGTVVRPSGERNSPVQHECIAGASWHDCGLQLRRSEDLSKPEHDVQGLSRIPGVCSMFLRHPGERV